MIDQPRERLWIEITVNSMITLVELLELNFVAHRATRYHVLYFEFGEFDRVANTSDSFCILFGSLFTVHLTLGASDDHFAVLENKCGCPCRFLESHDESCESLGIILSISTFMTNFQEV